MYLPGRSLERRLGSKRSAHFSSGLIMPYCVLFLNIFQCFYFISILTPLRHLQPLSRPRALPSPPLPGPVTAFPESVFCQQPLAFHGYHTSTPSRLRARFLFLFASTASSALHSCAKTKKQNHSVGSSFIPIRFFCPRMSCEAPPAWRPLGVRKLWGFLTTSLLPEGLPELHEC